MVSDNCSTDNTYEIVKKYQKENPDLRYRKNDENIGAARNYIECYNNAKGKFVYLLADDDVLLDGALEQITSFLDTHSDISLLYLNHVFFRDVYEGVGKCTAPYINISEDIVTLNKTEFMKYAGMRITFTPSLVISREDYLLIDNPEQYEYTRFLQTCVAFMCTKGHKKMGILHYPCVAANLPSTPQRYNGIRIFGINAKNLLCEIGGSAGYDKKEMNFIYKKYVLRADIKAIANAKIDGSVTLKQDYKECVVPAVKEYPIIHAILQLCMLIPAQVWKPIKRGFSRRKYGR